MTSRSVASLLAAALLVLPALARGQDRPTTIDVSNEQPPGLAHATTWIGAAGGLETVAGWRGYRVALAGEFPVGRIGPPLLLEAVVDASYAHLSGGLTELSLVPAARVNWAIRPAYGAYGDVGVGIYRARADGATHMGGVMRLAAGAYYELSPRIRVFAEGGARPHFGALRRREDGVTTYTVMTGVKLGI